MVSPAGAINDIYPGDREDAIIIGPGDGYFMGNVSISAILAGYQAGRKDSSINSRGGRRGNASDINRAKVVAAAHIGIIQNES